MIACVDIILCGILLAFVRTREVGVSSRNVVLRTFPIFSQSMLTPMLCRCFRSCTSTYFNEFNINSNSHTCMLFVSQLDGLPYGAVALSQASRSSVVTFGVVSPSEGKTPEVVSCAKCSQ